MVIFAAGIRLLDDRVLAEDTGTARIPPFKASIPIHHHHEISSITGVIRRFYQSYCQNRPPNQYHHKRGKLESLQHLPLRGHPNRVAPSDERGLYSGS